MNAYDTFRALIASTGQATFIDDQFQFGFQMPGTVLELRLEPELPLRGEPFQIKITGTATQVCPPVSYEVVNPEAPLEGIGIAASMKVCTIDSNGQSVCSFAGDCDPAELPIQISETLDVDPGVWSLSPGTNPGAIKLVLSVDFGQGTINPNPPIFSDKRAIYERKVDLQRGTHVIPPRLGSGMWISEETPNEGLLVQQQGDRVVFYELKYADVTTSQGNFVASWIYADAKFSGDSANGLAIQVARPNSGSSDVVFEEILSSSIIVDDVNHVRALFDAGPRELGEEGAYTAYRRWVFNLDNQNLPPVMPDFSGGWHVIRFDGGMALNRVELQLGSGTFRGENRWGFTSTDGASELVCAVNTRGEGQCSLSGDETTEVLHFDIADFNGNIAAGVFVDAAGSNTNEAVFLREQFDLP